ncbi:CCA tRNA nucleotidyltransferase [Alloiococcus sp. CFN-8]|uniref:CCA tRNA nucleotidyltransferase n=1 Tax=Alloiococcus sp. CFN-8 TaxID=3416081 RepID=UPI003CE92E0C
MIISLPKNVAYIIDTLYDKGFEAYAVGGCIRDSILGKKPNDWDITTSAPPEIIEKTFEKTIPTGIKHGTVTVLIDKEPFEVTTYRIDGEYLNNRRPEEVTFVSSLKEDLARRDFTINALAYNHKDGLKDYHNGLSDIKEGIIRTVGNPDVRFTEDALRLLRAVRFSCQLGFSLSEETYDSIKKNSSLIKNISRERIREELNKILLSDKPSKGFLLLESTGLLKYILPEAQAMVGLDQRNPHHDKDVFIHTLSVIDNAPKNLTLRLAALLHDIAKPETFTIDKKGKGHFYGHEKAGVEVSERLLRRLTYDNETIAMVKKLVSHHMMVFSSPKDSTWKKVIGDIGRENMPLLFSLQKADILASAPPHDLDKVEKLKKRTEAIIKNGNPLYIKDLEVTGEDIMNTFLLKPGRHIGDILNYLLERVLEKPELNNKNKLLNIAKGYIDKNKL